MPFTLIGRYEWIKEIGEGGFGAVELYRDLLNGEQVAIKTIPAMYVNQESKRLVREVDIMRFLHNAHPHLIGFFYMFATAAVNTSDKKRWHNSVPPTPPEMTVTSPAYNQLTLFEKLERHHSCLTKTVAALRSSGEFNVHIVMPLMSGDLFYFIKLIADPSRGRDLVTPEYLGPIAGIYAFQMCFGLDYLHQCGIVHRDMKPDNVLVRLDTRNQYMSTALIADMGLARDTGDSDTFYVCTRYYRPPDVVMGFSKGASATDIWSLGCIFYELCTCQTLFTMKSALNEQGTWDGYYASRQLEVILEIVGCPSADDIERFAPKGTNAKSYLQRSNPRTSKLDALLQKNWKLRVSDKVKIMWIDIIKSCLRFFPQQRPTAAQLCCHPLFRELNMFYGENVSQVPPQPYQPLYDEKTMSNQNRAENKSITLGLIMKALELTVPERDEVENEDDEEDDEDDENTDEVERHPFAAGGGAGSLFMAPSTGPGGISAYRAANVEGAIDEDEDDTNAMSGGGIAPSIYAIHGLSTGQSRGPQNEEAGGRGTSLLAQDAKSSMFATRAAASRAVIENEESDSDDEAMEDSSLSDTDDDGDDAKGRGKARHKMDVGYPSAFLRPSQDPPEPPQSSSKKAARTGSDGLDIVGSSFLGHYVAPSMFKQPETNVHGEHRSSNGDGAGDDDEGREPATLLRRTHSGSGNVHAPYSYMNSLRLLSASSNGKESKSNDTGNNNNANGDEDDDRRGAFPQSKPASAIGINRDDSDLGYHYPTLNDAYDMAGGQPAPPARAQTVRVRAGSGGILAADNTRPLATAGALPSFSLSGYIITREDGSRAGQDNRKPSPAASGRSKNSQKSSQKSSHKVSPEQRPRSGSQGQKPGAWGTKGQNAPKGAQTRVSPSPSRAGSASAGAQPNISAYGGVPVLTKVGEGDAGGYSYFDGDLHNAFNEGTSLMPAAMKPTAPPREKPTTNGSLPAIKDGAKGTAFGASGYSLLRRRVSNDIQEDSTDPSHNNNNAADNSKRPSLAVNGFPSLADKALEERYKAFARSDSGMQRGMSAVLAELNQSTDNPEKTAQLREIMNFFGTHRQARK